MLDQADACVVFVSGSKHVSELFQKLSAVAGSFPAGTALQLPSWSKQSMAVSACWSLEVAQLSGAAAAGCGGCCLDAKILLLDLVVVM